MLWHVFAAMNAQDPEALLLECKNLSSVLSTGFNMMYQNAWHILRQSLESLVETQQQATMLAREVLLEKAIQIPEHLQNFVLPPLSSNLLEFPANPDCHSACKPSSNREAGNTNENDEEANNEGGNGERQQ